MHALPPLPRRQNGAALVVSLSLLVLLTVLTLTFFMTVETDVQSSSANQNQVSLRQLSDLPLQIVETQIRAATTLGQTGSLNDAVNTWTSQPGLLRVIGNTGNLVRAYKLYSSNVMDEATDAFIGSEIPANWKTNTNQWVNLNEPYPSITDTNTLVWPILNPSAEDWAEGLTISADPAGDTDATMPVQWLYVLEDGSVSRHEDLVASKPPVGRIAFWTDDESCKININTAGERTMWDRPRAWHERREIYGKNQPSTGEYNAYPGHPATVSLSAALGKAMTGSQNQISETMLSLSPRYRWGGSENGTRTIWDRDPDWKKDSPTNIDKKNRLYATPSEFLFDVARDIPDANLKLAIEQSGFVLTESSRAPEINAFGLPRIGIWPIDTSEDKRTAHDKLIARSLTIGDKPYYFQRSNPLSKSEATSINRNWEILDYLDKVTQRPVNGFGGSFDSKWGNDRRQILTQIFDYVRGATNLSDTSRNPAEYSKQFTPAFAARRGFVVPTEISDWETRGLGRAPVLTHAAIVLYAYSQKDLVDDPTLPPDYETEVSALLWFNFFSPMHGLAPTSGKYRIRINSYQFAIKDDTMPGFAGFSLKGTTSSRFAFPRNDQGKDWGAYEGMLIFEGTGVETMASYEFHSANSVTIKGLKMDFMGGPLKLDLIEDSTGEVLQSYEFAFPNSTASWPIPMLWGGKWINNMAGAATNPYFDVDAFPTMNYSNNDIRSTNPMPFHRRVGKDTEGNGRRNDVIGHRDFGNASDPKPPVDVIRTIELKDGDARIIAGLKEVGSHLFTPGHGYFEGNRRLTGSLVRTATEALAESNLAENVGDQYGKPVDTEFKVRYNQVLMPILPKSFDNKEIKSLRIVDWAGDLDNGFLGEPDGPYANKPDEGHSVAQNSGTGLPYYATSDFKEGGQRILTWDPRINGFFSPTRQTPSPIMFGSLPTGTKRTDAAYKSSNLSAGRPWETLLFAPNSQAAMVPDSTGGVGHPGATSPHDHLLLDLFTMPVVEPYAITEPFSTAGKINMNQRIVPFGHIHRETGLHGVLKNMEFLAVPITTGSTYRAGSVVSNSVRQVDVPNTLKEIAKVLDPGGAVGKGVFRSASEICDIFLIPHDKTEKGAVNWTQGNPSAFWRAHQLTGDNSREAPYNYLYPLLTTKSNTYQVHYRVQTLKPLRKRSNFDPKKDFVVSGEQRGSYVIERYLDNNDPQFKGATPDVNPDTTPLNPFYQFRTLRHTRFSPGT